MSTQLVKEIKQDDNCDLCRRQGRDMCALHTKSTTDLRKMETARRVRVSVMDPNRTYSIRANEVVLKEGEWVCAYKGESAIYVKA